MVQFVFTPWRTHAELLRVRAQFYPSTPPTPDLWNKSSSSPQATASSLEAAVARVFMWVSRGSCPHVVESTALLVAAILFDDDNNNNNKDSSVVSAAAAARAAYITAFTRFVTGLLDGHQDRGRKLSMYGVARAVGLPASFVELRHQGTHEPLPEMGRLRAAAREALVWIWGYYWRGLPGEKEEEREAEKSVLPVAAAAAAAAAAAGRLEERMCRAALMGYLHCGEGEAGGEQAAREGLVRGWDREVVMRVLADVGGSVRDRGVVVRAVRLAREFLGGDDSTGEAGEGEGEEHDIEGLKKELSRVIDEAGAAVDRKKPGKRKKGDAEDEEEEEEHEGPRRRAWSRWEGPWTPRPIGII